MGARRGHERPRRTQRQLDQRHGHLLRGDGRRPVAHRAAGRPVRRARLRGRAVRVAGKLAFVAATLQGGEASGLALVARAGMGDWSVAARTPPQDGAPLRIAAVADFAGTGSPRVAAILAKGGRLQVWSPAADALTLDGEAPGYAAGSGDGLADAAGSGDADAHPATPAPSATMSAMPAKRRSTRVLSMALRPCHPGRSAAIDLGQPGRRPAPPAAVSAAS